MRKRISFTPLGSPTYQTAPVDRTISSKSSLISALLIADAASAPSAAATIENNFYSGADVIIAFN